MSSTLNAICMYIDNLPVTISNGAEQIIPIGANSEVYYSINYSKGDGNIDISAVMSEFESISFTTSINNYINYTINNSGYGASYYQSLGDNSSFSASIFCSIDSSVSADYTLSTTYNDDESMSATLGIRKSNRPNDIPPLEPELVTVPEPARPHYDLNLNESDFKFPIIFPGGGVRSYYFEKDFKSDAYLLPA